jgi:hypothetical protein
MRELAPCNAVQTHDACLVCLQVMHMCSAIAPNQDITTCLNNVWLMFNFSMGSFFVNYREVSQRY